MCVNTNTPTLFCTLAQAHVHKEQDIAVYSNKDKSPLGQSLLDTFWDKKKKSRRSVDKRLMIKK